MITDKMSKRTVLLASLLICVLAITLIALHTSSASPGEGDIDIIRIFPVTYPTWDPSLNLTFGVAVNNTGTEPINFNLTIYNATNDLPIAYKIVTLDGQTAEIVKLTLEREALPGYEGDPEKAWTYPTHDITAKASNVNDIEDVYDTEENVTVTVRWPGDADGDGHVNQTDVDIVGSLFGKNFPDPEYDPQADFNCDGLINVVDIVNAVIYPHKHNGPLDYADIQIGYVTLHLPGSHIPPIPVSVAYSNSTYSGWTIDVFVNVINNGNNAETSVIVLAYYRLKESNDWIVIGNTSVNVAAHDNEPATIPWTVPTIDGKPYHEYEVKANTTVLEWEDEPSQQGNNEKESDVNATIRWIGDATSNYKIDFEDLQMLRNAIDSYNVEVDFNGNGRIDLDDVAQLTDNWGPVPKA